MSFYKKKKRETFKTGKIDIIVFFVILFCFTYAFFFDSFIPLKNETGELIHSEEYWRDTGDSRVPKVNAFIIIGGLMMGYEILLFMLEGKKRGRYLPWVLYFGIIRYKIQSKIDEGKKCHKKYFEMKKK